MSFRFGDFTFDLATKFMDVAAGVISVDAQDVYNAAQEWGAEPSNMIYDTILTGGGKFVLDAPLNTKFTGLVVRMDAVDAPGPAAEPWALKFADAAGPGIELRRVFGGDFISDGDPVAPSSFTYIVIEQATSPTLVQAPTSGLTASESVQLAEVHGQIRRAIYIDTLAVSNGVGYQQSPYNNFTDAVDDAEANGITKLILLADATVDRQLKNFIFEGVGNPALDINNQNVDKSEFHGIELDGIIGAASIIHAEDCKLRHNLSGLDGLFEFCRFGGDLVLAAGNSAILVDCYSSIGGFGRPTLDTGGGGSNVSVRSYRGGLTVLGTDNVADEVTVSMAQGKLTLDATNTDGDISVRGVAQFTDNSAGSTVDTDGLLNQSLIAAAIWNALLSAHTVAGSFGAWVQSKLLSVAKFLALK